MMPRRSLTLLLVGSSFLGVSNGMATAEGPEPAHVSGYVRLALEAGDGWSMSCRSDEARSLVLAYTYGDGSGEFGATFSWSYALFARAKAGPVDKTVVVNDTRSPYGQLEMSKSGHVSGAETLVAVWGVWGGEADCAFTLNGSEISMGEPDAGHLGADEMESALIAQSPAGEVAALGGYGRSVDGTLFALLIPDTGLGTIDGPEGQHYEDRNSVVVMGEQTSGAWTFTAPVATSTPGLHLWILIVPGA